MYFLHAFDALLHQVTTTIDWSQEHLQDKSNLYLRIQHNGEFAFKPQPAPYISAHATLERHSQDNALRLSIQEAAEALQDNLAAQSLYLNVALGVTFGPNEVKTGSIRVTRGPHASKYARLYYFGLHTHQSEVIYTFEQARQEAKALFQNILALPITPDDPTWTASCATPQSNHNLAYPFHAPDRATARAVVKAARIFHNKPHNTVFELPSDEFQTFIQDTDLRPF